MELTSFKGFLLEDVLLKLLENNGFKLITQISANDENFVNRGNGINIVGRGGTHQFDSLGEFTWTIPFTYPVRLFVEAKYYQLRSPVNINIVRNAIAILHDINENYSTVNLENEKLMLPKFTYQYVIFSTSGFTNPAIRLAIAHNIFLIDISESNYIIIKDRIEETIEALKVSFPEEVSDNCISKEFAQETRLAIRKSLALINVDSRRFDHNNFTSNIFNYVNNPNFPLTRLINELGALYLASINSVYTIILKPLNNTDFIRSITAQPYQRVIITYDDNNRNVWKISNDLRNNQNTPFYLEFVLPKLISKYIFEESRSEDTVDRALNTKQKVFSKISFIVMDVNKNVPIFCTLEFDLESTINYVETH